MRAVKETVNAKQQELIRSHEDNARLSSEQGHLRAELHRLETEIRPLRTAREQLAVSELKNQQLEERQAQAATRVEELLIEAQGYAQKLEESTHAGVRLEAELTAAKAVLASHEQILQKLTVSQSAAPKVSGKPKGGTKKQESLFDSGK